MASVIKDIAIALTGPALIIAVASLIVFRHVIVEGISDGWKYLTNRDAWRRQHDSQRFHRRELMKVLLKLDEDSRAELFELYRERFGAGPARYAKKTYRKWQSGDVRPVTQTFERFMIELPRVMSFDLKCEALRAFVNEFSSREVVELSVTTSDWEEKIGPIVERLVARCYDVRLPAEVEKRLTWLCTGDMIAAAEILKQSRAEESRLSVARLREEFAALERLFDDPKIKPKVTHDIELPCGTIKLRIQKGL